MTEERIKELATPFAEETAKLLRTVAAEAREEGRKVGIDDLWYVLIKRMREERKPLEDWQINEEVERLKEKP